MEREKDLQQFLETHGLGAYLSAINNELMVQTLQQLHGVTESEMKDIRMSKPDIIKLKKAIKKLKKLTRSSSDVSKPLSSSNEKGSISLPRPLGKNIPMEQIMIQERLGEGTHCEVHRGSWTNDSHKYDVVIKKMKSEELPADFSKDTLAMQGLRHDSLCTFYGVTYTPDNIVMMIAELAPLGSLRDCLRNTSLRPSMTVPVLYNLAKQIAAAMTYLESAKFVHGSLAARNVLVFTPNKVKVGDFGVIKALGVEKDFFLADAKLSIAWFAPEVLKTYKFTTAGDVWSYGITLYEIFSYGKQPWELSTPSEVVAAIHSAGEQKLPKPDWCPSNLYMLMERCWHPTPGKRPTFSSLVSDLQMKSLIKMKAIRDCNNDTGTDMLSFRNQEEIIVLDMKPPNAPAWHYWKGVTSAGIPGFFNPTDAVDQSSTNTTPATSPSPQVNMRKASRNRSRKGNNKSRLTVDMIGLPEKDFCHRGHIGVDGNTFGNVTDIFGGSGVPQLPTKSGSSLQGSSANVSIDSKEPVLDEFDDFHVPDLSLSISASDFDLGTSFIDDMMKGLHTDKFSKKRSSRSGSCSSGGDGNSPPSSVCGDTSLITNGKKSHGNGVSINGAWGGAAPHGHLHHSNGIGMRSCSGGLEYHPRVTNAVVMGTCTVSNGNTVAGTACNHYNGTNNSGCGFGAASQRPYGTNSDNNFNGRSEGACSGMESSSPPTSNTRKGKSEGKSKRKSRMTLLLPGRERKDSSSSNGGLKQMSAADEKMLDDAIELANQFSANKLKSQSDMSPAHTSEPDTPSSKSKSKFFKFPSTKKSPKSEKKTFTDDLNSKTSKLDTPEAQAVYNELVAGGSSRENVNSSGLASEEEVNALRLLKKDGGFVATRPKRPSSNDFGKRLSNEGNPPLPPRQSRPNSTVSPPPKSRPKEMPPLPPSGPAPSRTGRTSMDDLSDMPCTPPPPVPGRRTTDNGEDELGLYNTHDPFWREDLRLSGEEEEEELSLPMQGKYKSRSDNVSYEDLTDFSSQHNGTDLGKTKRVMQRVLGDVTTMERENALLATNGDVHKAIKYVRLKQLLRQNLGDVERCKEALMQSNWIVQDAADYMLDHPPPSPDTVAV